MYKTIGIFAHVDSGKTTFAEQLLYLTETIRERGRVDYQNSFLDHHAIERERGITVFCDQASFKYQDSTYYLIDTPGHSDFSTEMERSMMIMDYAIIIICAVEGIQGHTETIWRLLTSRNIPVFFFINKVDREGANIQKVMKQIELRFSTPTLYISNADELLDMPDAFIETIASCDDDLMSHYFEGNLGIDEWKTTLKNLIREQKISPVMSGSALQNIGVLDFLSVLEQLTVTQYDKDSSFSGRVYKVRYDDKGEKLTYIKCLTGELSVKEIVMSQKENQEEKVNQIRLYNGNRFETTQRVEAGQLFAVTGLKQFKIRDGIGECLDEEKMEIIPTVQVAVFYSSSVHSTQVLSALKQLETEDPMLSVCWKQETQEIYIHIMGVIQLEILKEVLKTRYAIEVTFGSCEVIYLETIQTSVIGRGHYEPLKHYAEVHLKMEPAPRGSGVTFSSTCHMEQLSLGYQNLIKSYVLKEDLVGIKTGSLVTDIHVTLLIGAAHEKHTSGGDFKEATYRALRQGLEKASNLLLEPYYNFEIEVELDLMGRVLTDIQKAHGQFDPPIILQGVCILTGKVPVATFMDYPIEFMSLTRGKGNLNLVVSGYDVCHNPDEVIERKNYDKQSDRNNPSSSVFCSKGSGFVVPWNESDDYMHCKSDDKKED